MKPQNLPKIISSLALSLALLSLGLGAPRLEAEVLDRIIAKVNGDIITLSDFQARQLAALREANVPTQEQAAYLQANNRRLLNEAIDDLLIAQEAEAAGGRIPTEFLKKYIEEIKKDYGMKTDEEFEQELRREGVTIEEIMRNIERSALTHRYLVDEVDKKTTVSDAELRAEYEARKSTDYTIPARDHLQEILISNKESDPDARAAEVMARLRAGEDFATLAGSVSAAPSSEFGGDLGLVARRDMRPDLAAAVAKLEPGQVSEPMAARGGLRIVRLAGREPAQVKPFAEVKDALRQSMVARRRTKRLDEIAAKLREHAIIQDMVREVPLQVAPETPERPSLLEAAAAASPTSTEAEGEDEFVTTKGEVKTTAPPADTPAP